MGLGLGLGLGFGFNKEKKQQQPEDIPMIILLGRFRRKEEELLRLSSSPVYPGAVSRRGGVGERERGVDDLEMAAEKASVCVTGGGGFIASWLIKLLLSKDYFVHVTIRRPGDAKYAHLSAFEKAENLRLFKAELLDYDSIYSAVEGCVGVFHVASPVPSTADTVLNPKVEVIEPAVKGTQNVLKACVEAKVKRFIFVSSAAAVFMNPSWPKDQVMDETCWSNKEYCRTTKNWYCLSKTEAESEALELAKGSGLDIVSICPTLVFGPILQSTVNESSLFLLRLLKGPESEENRRRCIVDVRDVAEALILAFEKPEAEGRYICMAHMIKTESMLDMLKSKYPHYNYPKNFTEAQQELWMSSEKLQRLGWSYRPSKDTLIDSVESYRQAGLLD